jgi:hypothetical protein
VSVADEWGFSTAINAVDVTQVADLTVSGAGDVESGSAMASWLTALGVAERVDVGGGGVTLGGIDVVDITDKFICDRAACVLMVEPQPPLTHRTKMTINNWWMLFR